MELLEDSILYELDVKSLQALFEERAALANWSRKLAEQEVVKAEDRFMGRSSRSAAESTRSY